MDENEPLECGECARWGVPEDGCPHFPEAPTPGAPAGML